MFQSDSARMRMIRTAAALMLTAGQPRCPH